MEEAALESVEARCLADEEARRRRRERDRTWRAEQDVVFQSRLAEESCGGGPIALAEVCRLAWETVTAGYVLDDATDQQLATWRAVNDRDVRNALEVLQRLGAVRRSDRESVELSELALWALGRRVGSPAPGAPVFHVKVTLAEVDDPPVWRRLLLRGSRPPTGRGNGPGSRLRRRTLVRCQLTLRSASTRCSC